MTTTTQTLTTIAQRLDTIAATMNPQHEGPRQALSEAAAILRDAAAEADGKQPQR